MMDKYYLESIKYIEKWNSVSELKGKTISSVEYIHYGTGITDLQLNFEDGTHVVIKGNADYSSRDDYIVLDWKNTISD